MMLTLILFTTNTVHHSSIQVNLQTVMTLYISPPTLLMPPASSEKHCISKLLYISLAIWEIVIVDIRLIVFAGSILTPKARRLLNWVELRICDPLNSHTTNLKSGTMQLYVTFSEELTAMNWSLEGMTVGSSGEREREREREREKERGL